jgi:CBS domain-containing protein
MNVEQVMTRDVKSCSPHDTLNTAARIMWENDCGCVPVVDENARVVGVLTDRDICMATYTQGRTLTDIQVRSVMATAVHTCKRDDTIAFAEGLMQGYKIRRLPVTDADGRLVGILSLNDIVREAARQRSRKAKREVTAEHVTEMMAAICEPRSARLVTAA